MTGPRTDHTVGTLLREWRRRRALSQLGLSVEAGISQRHISCVESGRSRASRAMLMHLAEHLAMPLRVRNALLVAGGFAPVFPQRSRDDPDFAAALRTVQTILQRHQPFPALAIDRHWTLVLANDAVAGFLALVDPSLQTPPVNVLRLALHPRGMAPHILNFGTWRSHILQRLSAQIRSSGDPVLESLEAELRGYPIPPGAASAKAMPDMAGIAVPLQVRLQGQDLSFISTTTVFGTAIDVTLSELAVETFFPADDRTRDWLMQGGQARLNDLAR